MKPTGAFRFLLAFLASAELVPLIHIRTLSLAWVCELTAAVEDEKVMEEGHR